MTDPPSLDGRSHDTVSEPGPGVTAPTVGAPGADTEQNGSPSRSRSLSGTLRSSAGMHPVNRLLLRDRNCSSDRFPSSEGIRPVSSLKLSSKLCSLERFPRLRWYLSSQLVYV